VRARRYTVVRYAVAATAALLSLATACGTSSHGSDRAAPSSHVAQQTPSAGSASSAPPSGSDSTDPADPADSTIAQITKLTQQFLDADNVATQTGDFTARDALTSDQCTWCTQKRQYIAKIYDGVGKIDGELFVDSTIKVSPDGPGKYAANINTTVSAYTETAGDGSIIDQAAAKPALLSLTWSNATGTWLIVYAAYTALG